MRIVGRFFQWIVLLFLAVPFLMIQLVYAEDSGRVFKSTSEISISKIELDEVSKEIRVHFVLPEKYPLKDGWMKLVYSPFREKAVYDGTNWVWYSTLPAKSAVYSVPKDVWTTPGVYGNSTGGNPDYKRIWKDTQNGFFQICIVNDSTILCGDKPFNESNTVRILKQTSEVVQQNANTQSSINTPSSTTAQTSVNINASKNPKSATEVVSLNVESGDSTKSSNIQLNATVNTTDKIGTGNISTTVGVVGLLALIIVSAFFSLRRRQGLSTGYSSADNNQSPIDNISASTRFKTVATPTFNQGFTSHAQGKNTAQQSKVLRIYRVGNEYRIEFDQLYDSGIKLPEENRKKILQEIFLYIHAIQKLTKARGVREDLIAAQIEEYSLEKYGSMLYRLLFSEKMRKAIEATDGPLIIRTDDHEIPWELLHTGDSFIALERPMGREILFTSDTRINPVVGGEKLRMLCISNPTGDLQGSEQEVLQIYAKFGGIVDMTVISGRSTSVSDIFSQISRNDWDIIHYAGHANFRQNAPDESGLLLADGQIVSVSEIRRTLGGKPLVFLNACMTGRNISTSDARGNVEIVGLSSAFIAGGALGVIAPLWAINDDMAAKFAIEFYNSIFEYKSVGDSILHAKNSLSRNDKSGVNWSSFAYYGDPVVHLRSELENPYKAGTHH